MARGRTRDAILGLLRAADGGWVSSAALARAIYGDDDYCSVNAIRNTVNRIRSQGHADVETLRGFGYRIRPRPEGATRG